MSETWETNAEYQFIDDVRLSHGNLNEWGFGYDTYNFYGHFPAIYESSIIDVCYIPNYNIVH